MVFKGQLSRNTLATGFLQSPVQEVNECGLKLEAETDIPSHPSVLHLIRRHQTTFKLLDSSILLLSPLNQQPDYWFREHILPRDSPHSLANSFSQGSQPGDARHMLSNFD